MKLQNLTVIFIIIMLPIILLTSLYISTGIKTIKYQAIYDDCLLNATRDAVYAFEQNSINNKYSNNAETKRSIIKASVKMFQTSLAAGCNISTYDSKEIDNYIPALVFGMYDGFYMYAPTLKEKEVAGEIKNVYEKDLKSYVYYSEVLENAGKDGSDIVIIYSLDNYITMSGDFGSGYEIKAGYLIDLDVTTSEGTVYKNISIDASDADAVSYYKNAYTFTNYIKNNSYINLPDYLKPWETIDGIKNDPENPDSAFVKHKHMVIREKMQAVLNSIITAYSNRTWGTNYKMPKLSEEDWEKIYNNISMISFFQGKQIGLTKYNGYCVLNSTNSKEYVNPNLMYFIDDSGWYHDIRCSSSEFMNSLTLKGYRIGSFENKKIELKPALEEIEESDGTINYKQKTDPETGNLLYIDEDGVSETTKQYKYKYNHLELACYECINGQLDNKKSVYEYINSTIGDEGVDYASDKVKTAYWTSLARERYNTTKLTK